VRKRILGVGLLALIAAAPAAAHVIPQPAFLTPGVKTTVTLVTPNERRPHVLLGFTLTAPPGIELERATPPPGWKLVTAGRTADWSLGATTHEAGPDVPFRIVASTSLAPGTTTLSAVQRYDDGGIVRWKVGFTILPTATQTPKQHLLPAVVTAILGLVVIGLLLLRMRQRRQPDVQED
jgi:uncharacterized protein YcnI